MENKSKVQEVAFTGMTRTFGSGYLAFAPEDMVGLYVVDCSVASAQGGLKPAGNLFDNLKFSWDGETMKPLISNFYPAEVSEVDFYAYSPYVSGNLAAENLLSFSVKQDQSTPGNLKQSDLLWGKLLNVQVGQSTSPRIVFEHRLSKIIINLRAGNGITLNTPVVLIGGVKSSAKLNMVTGRVTSANGTVTSITPLQIVNMNEYQSIIVPQVVNISTCLFTVTNNGKTYSYILKADKTFQEGVVYTFDITVKPDSLEVSFSGTVNDWILGDTVVEDITG